MYEKTLATKSIYKGRILDLEVLDIEMENGVKSIREIIRHQSAIAVIAMLPDERFVFVRQFRKAVEQDVLEIIAGLKEDGETAEECAWREILEETGYTAQSLIHLGKVFPSPGYTEEYIDLFFAALDAHQLPQSQDDDEKVDIVHLTEAELTIMMQNGDIHDAKLLAAWLLYEKLIKNALNYVEPSCSCCTSCHEN